MFVRGQHINNIIRIIEVRHIIPPWPRFNLPPIGLYLPQITSSSLWITSGPPLRKINTEGTISF